MEVKPMAVPTFTTRLRHALFGCRLIDHIVLTRDLKVITVGRICPFCFREYPING